ncbi:MAG: hypothetical protein JXB60_02420 [Candidatus Cloacimonetes bacterium]|nr:hypothetical protein [Candidatus Cloacimonadota bacterium]
MKMNLLLWSAIIFLVVVGCVGEKPQADPALFWKEGKYCVQTTALTQEEGSRTVRARMDGKWHDYELVEFTEEFMEWNLARRKETIELFRAMMRGEETGEGPDLAGPHNGIVATYGFQREDSQFKLNNAVKGMGFLPRREVIAGIITMLEENMDAPMPVRLEKLAYLYEKADSIFARDKQISLELYSQPEFMTQSFLNQMVNPVATIVFLDIPSYKLKTVVRLLHPEDPDLTAYERDVVKYINLIHGFFHGPFSKNFIAVIYYTVEIFDNSPMGSDPETGMGRRVAPPLL